MRGQQYDQLIDELLEALRERFGTSLLIHWEDFGSQNSYRLLARARAKAGTSSCSLSQILKIGMLESFVPSASPLRRIW